MKSKLRILLLMALLQTGISPAHAGKSDAYIEQARNYMATQKLLEQELQRGKPSGESAPAAPPQVEPPPPTLPPLPPKPPVR